MITTEMKAKRGKCLALAAVLAMVVCAFAVALPAGDSDADTYAGTAVVNGSGTEAGTWDAVKAAFEKTDKVVLKVVDDDGYVSDITIKENEIAEREEILGQRLRGVYKSSIGSEILNLVLSADNLGDIISVLSNVKVLVQTDNDLINQIAEMKEDLQNQKVNLEDRKSQVEKDKTDLESAKAELSEVTKQYENQVNELI